MSKILIVYYSLFQNTKRFAEEIANQTGGALKEIIPFCTHGGGGFGQMIEDIAAECPDSLLLEGLALGGGTVNADGIRKWLEQIDIGID